MTDQNETETTPPEPEIPRPPSREEVEAISRDQALITDEWTGEEPPPAEPAKP